LKECAWVCFTPPLGGVPKAHFSPCPTEPKTVRCASPAEVQLTNPKEPDTTDPAEQLPPESRARVRHLDRICSTLEDGILAGRGDVAAMRAEWRACQEEMRELEADHG
jgi:hypothetical protein